VLVAQPRRWSPSGEENLEALGRAVGRVVADGSRDLLVLPEHVGADLDRTRYIAAVQLLARRLGVWVVGGSHHLRRREGLLNCGVVVDPRGDVVAEYHKLNPYGFERGIGVRPGDRLGVFEAEGVRVAVLVCADFFFSDLLHKLDGPVDIIAVPAFSLTRAPRPAPARTIWRHMSVSRAYESGVYVAVSDWAPGTPLAGHHSAGVAGVANPHAVDGEQLWRPIGRPQLLVQPLDLGRLAAFREDRRVRGLFRPEP
jgi:predicted amidohydrolase